MGSASPSPRHAMGRANGYWKASDGTGAVERLTSGIVERKRPSTFSPVGSALVFVQSNPPSLQLLSLTGERRDELLLETSPFVLSGAQISPDGRWLAYASIESGRNEIYVRPFPDVDAGKWQISSSGGGAPVWARDGRELFYLDQSGTVLAVSVDGRESFQFGNSEVHFEA